MTNEEIKNQLQDIKCHCQEMYEAEIKNGDSSSSIWGKDVEALDLAIKALEQQPCGDCISRKEALKLMCEKCPVYDCITGCQSYRSIEKMSSVTPKGVTVTDFADRCRECGSGKVLDKIRAEIEHLHDWAFSREEILRIIDKYRVESEVEG